MINKVKKNEFILLLKETKMFIYALAKGTIIFSPRSTSIWELIKFNLDKKFKEINVENVKMPALIPLKYMKKEQENFKGFEPELITITKIGKKTLMGGDSLILRPTSEVIFSHYFKKVLKSYRDLPILINQWSNVWRWENNTNPFLRTTEFFWNEGHTIHETKEDSFVFCNKIYKIYENFIQNKLLIPLLKGEKSSLERFAGAKITWALETILPDGQFLQLSTVHYLGCEFSKIFDVNFLNRENKKTIPHQTSWAISTRLLAGIFLIHKDEEGLKLPPFIADFQIVIIPINKKNKLDIENIKNYCNKLKNELILKSFRVKFIENLNKNSGFLRKEYRKYGIPIYIEIGINEVKNQIITYQLRTENIKKTILLIDFLNNISILIKKIEKKLFEDAKKRLESSEEEITSYIEYKKIKKKNKIYKTYFCGEIECEKTIKDETGTTSRLLNKIKKFHKCFKCNKKTNFKSIFGRSY